MDDFGLGPRQRTRRRRFHVPVGVAYGRPVYRPHDLRHVLDPIDLYVRHTSAIPNALLERILPLIEPTRFDLTLKKFSNYDELWELS